MVRNRVATFMATPGLLGEVALGGETTATRADDCGNSPTRTGDLLFVRQAL